MLFAAAGAMLWAVVEGIGALLASDHDPLQVVWVRYATHLAILLIAFGPRRGTAMVSTTRPFLQVIRGLLMLLMPLCFLAALALTKPENTLSIFWVTPLLTMALAVWLLREHVKIWQWIAAVGGWVGAVLIVRPGSGLLGPAIVPALGMAACLSLYLVMTRMLRDESTLTNLTFTAACVLVPLSFALPWQWSMPTVRTLALMALVGVLGLAVLYAFDRATELAPVSEVVPMLYAQPIALLSLEVIFDGIHPGRAALLGTVGIMTTSAFLLATVGWRLAGTVPELQPEPATVRRIRMQP